MSPVYKYGEEERKKEAKGKKSKIKVKNMYIKDGKFFVRT